MQECYRLLFFFVTHTVGVFFIRRDREAGEGITALCGYDTIVIDTRKSFVIIDYFAVV